MKIILGSSSKWRAEALRRAGYEFEVMSADIDEKAIRCAEPEKLVQALAGAKADALQKKIDEPALLITADQVVYCDGEIREKPVDEFEARKFLRSYAEFPAKIVNGLAVTDIVSGRRVVGVKHTTVTFKPSIISIIDDLILHSNALQAAGAIITENPIVLPHVEATDGGLDDYAGLPIDLLKRLMTELGY